MVATASRKHWLCSRYESGSAFSIRPLNLRILHLGKFYPPAPGGIETHLRTLALSQARLGADVRVLCVNHADRAGADITWSRFRRTDTAREWDGPVRVVRLGRRASLARLDICPELLGELRREIHRGADVVHLQVPNPTMLIALAVAGSKVPIVVTHHSDIVRQRWLRHAVTPFERRVYARASVILSDSPPYLEGSATLGRYRDKVVTLPLGIDLAPFLRPSAAATAFATNCRKELGEPLWLMVGRLVYYKGIEVALRALVQAPGRLLIIGTGPARGIVAPVGRLTGNCGSRCLARPCRGRGINRSVPSGDGAVVSERRPQRGVRVGAGRSDGQRMPGVEHGDPL